LKESNTKKSSELISHPLVEFIKKFIVKMKKYK